MFCQLGPVLAATALLSIAQAACPQQHVYWGGYPVYGYRGFYPYYGYDGFYANGFTMYGPPVPTYAPVPGYFGGGDQRLNHYIYPEPVRSRPWQSQPAILVQPLPAEIERHATDLPRDGSK